MTVRTEGHSGGRVSNFGCEIQETNDLALRVMNGGVESLNSLHVLCLILNGSNLQHKQILDIKKRFPVCACLYREQVEHLKIPTTEEIAIGPKN